MKIKPKRFTGSENHSVTAIEAIDFIRTYRELYPDTASGCYADAQSIKMLIEQSGSVGMRYYYTLDKTGRKGLILVGTNSEHQDLLQGEPIKRAMPNPPFTPNGTYDRTQLNHSITLEVASNLSANYRKQSTSPIKGGFFGKDALNALLAQKDCVGIHFLFGAQKDATPVMVMVGVDKYGTTMFFRQLMEMSSPCPPFCGYDNELNSSSRIELSSTVESLL